jgi:hypothetical protein
MSVALVVFLSHGGGLSGERGQRGEEAVKREKWRNRTGRVEGESAGGVGLSVVGTYKDYLIKNN